MFPRARASRMADGFAMARVLISMMAPPTRTPPAELAATAKRRSAARKANVAQMKKEGYGGFSRSGGIVSKSFSALMKLLLLPDDPASVLKPATAQDSAGPKSAAFRIPASTIPELKQTARALDAAARASKVYRRFTVNDVIATALSCALNRWAAWKEGGGKLSAEARAGAVGSDVQAVLWVSMTPVARMFADPADVPIVLGNGNLAAIYLDLPLSRSSSRGGGQKDFTADVGSGFDMAEKTFPETFRRLRGAENQEGIDRLRRAFAINTRASALKGSPEPLLAT